MKNGISREISWVKTKLNREIKNIDNSNKIYFENSLYWDMSLIKIPLNYFRYYTSKLLRENECQQTIKIK